MLLPFIGVFYMISNRRKELIEKEIFIFSIYIVLITLAQFLISILAFNCINNILIFHLFIPIEFSLFTLILLLFIINSKIAYIISTVLFIHSYLFTFLNDSWYTIPTEMIFINNSFLLFVIILCLVNYIKVPQNNNYRLRLYRGMFAYILGNILSAIIFQTHFYEALIIHNLLNIYANVEFFLIYKQYGAK